MIIKAKRVDSAERMVLHILKKDGIKELPEFINFSYWIERRMIMIRNQLAEDYKNACRKEMKKDLIEEYEKIMNSDTISDKKKDWVFQIVMNVLKFSQEV